MEPNQRSREIAQGLQWDDYLSGICQKSEWEGAGLEKRLYWLAMATLKQDSPLRQPIKERFSEGLKVTFSRDFESVRHEFFCGLDVDLVSGQSLSQVVSTVRLTIAGQNPAEMIDDKPLSDATVITWPPEPELNELQTAALDIIRYERPSETNELTGASPDATTFPENSRGTPTPLQGPRSQPKRERSNLSMMFVNRQVTVTPPSSEAIADAKNFLEESARIKDSQPRVCVADPQTVQNLFSASPASPVPLPDKTDAAPLRRQPATSPLPETTTPATERLKTASKRPLLKPALLIALIAVGGLALWKAKPFQKLVDQA